MPKFQFKNFGDVQNHIKAKGVITAVDSDNDLADVTVDGYQDGEGVPLFYHCEPDSEERSNGAIEGAAAAFSVDDEVIVMLAVDGPPVRIVGFVEGIKVCGCKYAVFNKWDDEISHYRYLVWNMKEKTIALDLTKNDGHPITLGDYPIRADEDASDNESILRWMDNAESCEDVSNLWIMKDVGSTEPWHGDTDTTNEDIGCPADCIGYWNSTRVIDSLTASGPYSVDTYNSDRYAEQANCYGILCEEPQSFMLSQLEATTKTFDGFTWEAQNGSEQLLNFYKKETYYDFHDQRAGDEPYATFIRTVTYDYYWDLFSPAQAAATNTGETSVSKPIPEPRAYYSFRGAFHEKQRWLMMVSFFKQSGEITISAISEYGLTEAELRKNPTSFTPNSALSELLSSGEYDLSPSYYK